MREGKIFTFIRWLFIIPSVLITSGITFYIFGMIAGLFFLGPFEENNLSIPASIVSFATSVVWVLTAFILAPKFKREVVWGALISGVFSLFISCAWLLESSFFSNWKDLLPLIGSAIIPNLILCIAIQNKTFKTDLKQNMFNTLDQNL